MDNCVKQFSYEGSIKEFEARTKFYNINLFIPMVEEMIKNKNIVRCMICGCVESANLPDDIDDEILAVKRVIRDNDWAGSFQKQGYFVCCPECYPNAFDTSVGEVGRLKPELYHLLKEIDKCPK